MALNRRVNLFLREKQTFTLHFYMLQLQIFNTRPSEIRLL